MVLVIIDRSFSAVGILRQGGKGESDVALAGTATKVLQEVSSGTLGQILYALYSRCFTVSCRVMSTQARFIVLVYIASSLGTHGMMRADDLCCHTKPRMQFRTVLVISRLKWRI